MTTGVYIWWIILCVVTVFNLFAWLKSAEILARYKPTMQEPEYKTRRWLLWLSGIYVLGCGFRSVLPRVDVQRICLVDTWWSNIMIGRSVATVAEICFVIQWVLLLRFLAKETGLKLALRISVLLIPTIIVAEMFSWYAVITTNNIGHVVEESLWTLAALLLLASFLSLWQRIDDKQKLLLSIMTGVTAAYVIFMVAFDVPMYLSRWQMDTTLQQQYFSLSQGIQDLSSRWIVTHEWEAWGEEIPWMTLYFSVAVWFSIALAHTPKFKDKEIPPLPTNESSHG